MRSEHESQRLPETPPSIRQELIETFTRFRKEGFDLPKHAVQELIALCELIQEVPTEEDAMKLLPKDFSIFFIDQDGSETFEIIRNVRATLEYAPEQERPALIRSLEAEIANQIQPNTKLSLSLLTLLGVASQYRADNKASGELLQVNKEVLYPFDSLSPSASKGFILLQLINRPYANVLSHKILDFFEHYSSALIASLPQDRHDIQSECAKKFYGIADIMARHRNSNFLIYGRYLQLGYFIEGKEIGGKRCHIDSFERYRVKHFKEENESGYLIGKDNNPNAHYYQLAPHYIAEYQKTGRMSAIFFATDEDYEALNAAKANATAAIMMSPHLEVWLRNYISHLFPGEEVNILSFAEKRGHSPHYPLAKEDFFTALHPGAASFDPASYDEYSYLMCLQMREIIENHFGITLNHQPLWVQRNFLSFFSQQDIMHALSMRDFVKQFGNDALTSLLATEGDLEFGAKLIDIGRRFGNAAAPLFQKYAKIAQTAYRAADYLRENFGGGPKAEPVVRAFTVNLLARGKELLHGAVKKKNQKELLADLEMIDEQASMICAGVAALKGEHIDLEDVKLFHLHEFTSKEMRTHKEITRMVHAGYEKSLRKEWGDNAKVDRLLAELDARVNDPENKSRFYVILREDKTPKPLIGSAVFTDTAPHEKFWSALFFETAYRGSGFYPSIIMQALEKESKDALIRGKTSVWKDIAASYIEQAKFEGVSFHYDKEEQDGVLIIDRQIKSRSKPEFPSPLLSFSLLDISEQIAEKKSIIAFEVDTRDLFDPRIMQEIFAPLAHGYVLSRYTKNAEHAQLVFEYRG
ncbi:hypothetical protein HYW94_00875 [Candidatus Uhrbacteria bacterium]|nr:hypothetical protein [Candidatus Uhrbacteria bacterium]